MLLRSASYTPSINTSQAYLGLFRTFEEASHFLEEYGLRLRQRCRGVLGLDQCEYNLPWARTMDIPGVLAQDGRDLIPSDSLSIALGGGIDDCVCSWGSSFFTHGRYLQGHGQAPSLSIISAGILISKACANRRAPMMRTHPRHRPPLSCQPWTPRRPTAQNPQ